MYDAYIIGSLALDLYGRFDKYPNEGEEVFTPEISINVGGTAYNVAIGFMKNGIKPILSACIGNDIAGQIVEQKLQEKGIESLLTKVENRGTTIVFSILTPKERTMLTYEGAEGFFKPTQLIVKTAKKSKITYISSYVITSENSFQQLKLFLKEIKLHTHIAFSAAKGVLENKLYQIAKIIKDIDILFVNEEEYLLLANHLPKDKEVVITYREKGATYTYKNHSIRAIQRKKVKKGRFVGAGDAFCAGFLSGRIKGLQVKDCLSLGNETALSWILQR